MADSTDNQQTCAGGFIPANAHCCGAAPDGSAYFCAHDSLCVGKTTCWSIYLVIGLTAGGVAIVAFAIFFIVVVIRVRRRRRASLLLTLPGGEEAAGSSRYGATGGGQKGEEEQEELLWSPQPQFDDAGQHQKKQQQHPQYSTDSFASSTGKCSSLIPRCSSGGYQQAAWKEMPPLKL